MSYNFDKVIERRGTNSIKWRLFPEDVLPLWVADMDFAAPEPIQIVLKANIAHGVLGYEMPSKQLQETVAARMEKLYGWQVSPDAVVATPGVVAGFTVAAQAVCSEGEGILVQPPVYPPFLKLHECGGWINQSAPLVLETGKSSIRYGLDFDLFQAAIHSGGGKTGMFLLCNPHNPTGQVYTREELERMADLCLRNNVVICSDEIHCELLLDGTKYLPIATLAPEVAERTITLIAPSKTFNIPGLFCGFAIIPNKDLLEHYKKTVAHMAMHVSSLGLTAAQVAFSGACDDWLAALRIYLTRNRDFLVKFVQNELDGIRTTVPNATYLAWLDCTEPVKSGKISTSPQEYFLKQAKVAFNDGREFGSGGEGFVRLNFGCPRSILTEALGRMKSALAG